MPVDIDATVIANRRLSDGLQRARARRAGDRRARAARSVRDDQAVARTGSAAPASVLDLRNPPRAARAPAGRLDLQQAHRRRHGAAVTGRTRRALRLPRSARPAVRAGRSARRSLDGRRRRRPRAVRHAGGRAARARERRRALFYGARRAAELYCVELFERSASGRARHRRRQPGRPRAASPLPLEAALRGAPARQSRAAVRVRPDADDARARRARGAARPRAATCRSSR